MRRRRRDLRVAPGHVGQGALGSRRRSAAAWRDSPASGVLSSAISAPRSSAERSHSGLDVSAILSRTVLRAGVLRASDDHGGEHGHGRARSGVSPPDRLAEYANCCELVAPQSAERRVHRDRVAGMPFEHAATIAFSRGTGRQSAERGRELAPTAQSVSVEPREHRRLHRVVRLHRAIAPQSAAPRTRTSRALSSSALIDEARLDAIDAVQRPQRVDRARQSRRFSRQCDSALTRRLRRRS